MLPAVSRRMSSCLMYVYLFLKWGLQQGSVALWHPLGLFSEECFAPDPLSEP